MLGDNIRMLRLKRGSSPEELGSAIGVSKEAIEYYEANKWRPGTQIIARMAKFFDVTMEEIIGDCSLLYDDTSQETLIVKNMGGMRFKVIGKVKDQDYKSE
jgi:transcriptional regulator with XRE-family HTH domain